MSNVQWGDIMDVHDNESHVNAMFTRHLGRGGGDKRKELTRKLEVLGVTNTAG